MTLDLECWDDELSPIQKSVYERAKTDYFNVGNKLKELLSNFDGEELYSGEFFSAFELTGNVAVPNIVDLNDSRSHPKKGDLPADTLPIKATVKQTKKKRSEDDDEDVPLKRFAKNREREKDKEKIVTLKKESPKEKKLNSQKKEKTVPGAYRPSEVSSIGGLAIEKNDDSASSSVETKDNNFNKMQEKMFPSLIVTARPSLKVREVLSLERNALDSKVKIVLMLTPSKFTEWLIQQGLLKSEQKCALHPSNDLKLGVYSDGSKFPYSGGYVWISECCPTRFVSVFYGSLFEGATNPPSSILKLIYHWACQTNIQNVVQWVKVDNMYIKLVYTWLRAICTLALHQHSKPIGGPGKFIEVGVISLGTTTQDGQKRQVKVEVLGVLDFAEKKIRLRAIEPFGDSDRNYKKRFVKILEPINDWILKESIILTDLTVDKSTLNSMGYKNVIQTVANDMSNKHTNANIMDYLRRIVPRMFQNTLSLLPNQIIQQFLDELVWRELYGGSALQTFDNITAHIAEQTRLEAKETLIQRLFKVATFPFKEWKSQIELTSETNTQSPDANTIQRRTIRNPTTSKETLHAEDSRLVNAEQQKTVKRTEVHQKTKDSKKEKNLKVKPNQRKIESSDINSDSQENEAVGFEEYYYGILHGNEDQKFQTCSNFVAKCPECKAAFDCNIDLQKHILMHVNISGQNGTFQCTYCMEKWEDEEGLQKHIDFVHPNDTKNTISSTFNCIICENRFNSIQMLNVHMQRVHVPSELPYKCGCCNYRSSSHRNTIDHFYDSHRSTGVLQCPLCLMIFHVFAYGKIFIQNIHEYLTHLKKYTLRNQCKRCNKCSLSFTSKGCLKIHQMFDHQSYCSNKKVKKMLESTIYIQVPKVKTQVTKEAWSFVYCKTYENLRLGGIEGKMCLECNVGFEEDNHFAGVLKCQKCSYHTCCLRAMLEHTSSCQSGVNPESNVHITLDKEMHCVCGFSNLDGNSLARHLALCEHKSAYPSVEAAQENTVKRNMLDMLGLMRRGEESTEKF